MAAQAVPPGWRHNPSHRAERGVVAVVAMIGCAIAIYLTLDQVGAVAAVWEPFFGHGAEAVLHSSVAQLLPVPDASLGALAYAAEVALLLLGDDARWRTAPWLVLAYGVVAVGLGLVSIVLVCLQAFVFHAWCTLCLTSAAISIVLMVPAVRECLAALGFLQREHERGRSFWQALHGAAG